jgi:radial spoke head protein 4A
LRCQIARISSATVISPKGYYIVDPDAEEPDESSGSAPIIINPEYEGNSNEQLLSISNWIHHIPYILPQGRVLFEAPKLLKEEAEKNEDEADEEDEGEEENTVEAETGPAVLNPVNNDDGN